MSSKHTKRGRKARRRAHHLREAWMRAPLRVYRTSKGAVLVCYVCRAVQGRHGEESHYAGCSVLRLNPGLDPVAVRACRCGHAEAVLRCSAPEGV